MTKRLLLIVTLLLTSITSHAQVFRRGWGALKPPMGTLVNFGHPLAKGLRIAMPFNEDYIGQSTADVGWSNTIHNYGSWPIGTTQEGPTTYPRGPRLDEYFPASIARVGRKGGGTKRPLTARWAVYLTTTSQSTDFVPLSGGCTVMIGWQKRDATARYPIAFNSNGSAGSEIAALIRYTSIGTRFYFGGQPGEGTYTLTWASHATDYPVQDEEVLTFSTGARGMQIWRNGKLEASNSADPVRASNTSTAEFRLGHGTDNESERANIDFFYLWARQLTTTEIVYASKFPFDMFNPPPNWLSMAAVAAGATGNFTAFHGGGR